MFENLTAESARTAIVCAAISILFCLAQIFLRKKVNFMSVCKVTVYVPLLSIIIKIIGSNAEALYDIAMANDLGRAIIFRGVASMLSALSFGIVTTIALAVLYAVTDVLVKNQKLA